MKAKSIIVSLLCIINASLLISGDNGKKELGKKTQGVAYAQLFAQLQMVSEQRNKLLAPHPQATMSKEVAATIQKELNQCNQQIARLEGQISQWVNTVD